MRRTTIALAFMVIVAAGVYAGRQLRAARFAAARAARARVAESLTPTPALPPPWARAPLPAGASAPPGTYTPRGFAADFRERVKHDFSDFAEKRLSHPLTPEQAARVAAVQDAFWDRHGPNVDLFRAGRIGQPEFAARTHEGMIAFAQGMEKIFDDDDYQKLFDVPKASDPFPLLFHSKEEQPGLAMNASLSHPTAASAPSANGRDAPRGPVLPQPAPTAVDTTASTAPPVPSHAKGAPKT
jgi:hypothetical protein